MDAQDIKPRDTRPGCVLEGVIVGGGISGLALAHFLGLGQHSEGWEIWEADSRCGGTIGTDRAEGYSIDWGPNGFLDREPLTLLLVEELGLSDQLERAGGASDNRFIMKDGRLHPVPLSPLQLLRTGLLTPGEKLRVFAEPLISGRTDDGDETVFDFAARRIGRSAAETFVDPMVSGIFGGLARQLSLPACFPIMREMELRYGGLVRALIGRQIEKFRNRGRKSSGRKRQGGPAGPAGRLTSFRGGLDVLVAGLSERLAPVVRLGHLVERVSRDGDAWRIEGRGGKSVLARRAILACPAFAAARILEEHDRVLSKALGAIPYAPIVVVASGHRRQDIAHPLDGFGFLVPHTQGLRTLGSIWTSSIFAERAPAGHVQFRTMLGGAGDPQVMDLSDRELWETVRREIGPLVGMSGQPAFLRTYRWEQGIPQFVIGHRQRRSQVEEICRRNEGLHVVGNAYYGVGLNDCVKLARRVADAIRPRDVH